MNQKYFYEYLMDRLSGRIIQLILILSCMVFLGLNESAHANPQGGEVAAGSAVISQPNSNTTLINQTSDKAIINWQSFNIGSQEATHFQQPSQSSIALNRINPNQGVSQIYGHLSANGQVWLLNPAGIYFGPSARVDVAGIIATTANMSNQDFLSGNYQFTSSNSNGAIINDGIIKTTEGGLVALVGSGVVNNGQIEAELGTVVLASGGAFTVHFSGNNMVEFAIQEPSGQQASDQNAHPLKDAVSNAGKIMANGGKIQMEAKTAGQVLDHAINMKGVAVANSVNVKNGEIILLASNGKTSVSGTLEASGKKTGESGGTIKVLGKQVAVHDQAKIDVSGDKQGGTILIGGDFKGSNPSIQNAKQTYVGPAANLYADALSLGNGGKVIVWANDTAQFYGNINARGGPLGGNGGLVETSGKAWLEVIGGTVDASAPFGTPGTWLLDPRNVTISTITANGVFSGGDPDIFIPIANNATVDAVTINTALNIGTNVTINTGSTGTQAGNITVSSAILKDLGLLTTPTLTLDAAGDIRVNNTISATSGRLNVTFIAGDLVNIQSDITTNGGNFLSMAQNATTIGSGIAMNTGAGTAIFNVNADGAGAQNFNMNANSSISSTNNTSDAVKILVNTALGGTGAATLRSISTGTSGGRLTVKTDNGGNTTGGNITTPSGTISAGALEMSTPNALTISIPISATGTVTLKANQDGLGGQDFNMNSTDSSITTTDASALAIDIQVGILGGSGSGNAQLRDMTTGSGGTLSVTSFDNDITQTGGTLLNVGTGTINLTTGQNTGQNIGTNASNILLSAENVNATSGSNGIFITNSGTGSLNLRTINTTGDFSLTSTGSTGITDSGTITVGDTTTLAAGSGQNITLNTPSNNFNVMSITSGNNVTIRDADAIDLGTSTITDDFNLTTNGAITDSGNLSIGGIATLAAGSANDIILDRPNNNFNTVAIANANNVTLRDANALVLGASNISGNLMVEADGALTQIGRIAVTGTSSFDVGANPITLNNGSNSFTGAVALLNSGTNDVSLTNSTSLIMAESDMGQNLNLTSGGSISQTGIIDAANGTTTVSLTTANQDILLDTQANKFGAFAFDGTQSNIRDVGIQNTNNAATLPDFSGLTNLRNLTLNFSGTNISLPAMTLHNGGNLSVTTRGVAGSAITQTGALIVPGTASFTSTLGNSGNRAIILSNAGNQFTGAVSLDNNSASADANITNSLPLVLGTISIGNGDLTLNGVGISQTGSIITGNGLLTLTGNAGQIDLTNAANNIGGTLTASNTAANDVSLVNSGAFLIDDINLTGASNLSAESSGQLTITTPIAIGGQIDLSGNSILLNADLTAGGNITLSSQGTGTTLGSNINLSGQDLTFDTTINGGFDWALDASSTGNIIFNKDVGAVTRLNTLSISNANNVTNLGSLNVTEFSQNTGLGLTAFGNNSLHVTGNALVETNNVTGFITVGGLTLDTARANLFGTVNGLSGQAAINQIVLLNTITAGTHFFDGIDMFKGPTPPIPFVPPVPPVIIPDFSANIVFSYAYQTLAYNDILKTLTSEYADTKPSLILSGLGKDCVYVSSLVIVCGYNVN